MVSLREPRWWTRVDFGLMGELAAYPEAKKLRAAVWLCKATAANASAAYACTLPEGHRGPHLAGITGDRIGAAWVNLSTVCTTYDGCEATVSAVGVEDYLILTHLLTATVDPVMRWNSIVHMWRREVVGAGIAARLVRPTHFENPDPDGLFVEALDYWSQW